MKKLKSVERLEDSFNKLPSVGRKSAERLAYSIIDMSEDDVKEFSNALLSLKQKVHFCPICGNITEDDVCDVCKDEDRDQTTLMIVSYPKDLQAFENSEGYKGLYHVLNGVISVSKGKGIEDLNIDSLLKRLENKAIKEVIIATNPTIEGEATGIYVSKIIAPYVESITRLAYGLQMGGNLDYTDSLTLSKAIEGRRKI